MSTSQCYLTIALFVAVTYVVAGIVTAAYVGGSVVAFLGLVTAVDKVKSLRRRFASLHEFEGGK